MAVAGALFSLLALVAVIVTDLHDRDFPQAIGAQSRLGLDFGESQFSDREAFAALTQMDADWNLGLVRIAPDLAGDSDERIFVALNDGSLPATFRWFSGAGAGRVAGRDRLANSPPDGSYLVTGDKARLAELESRLSSAGVRVTRIDASVTDSLRFAMREGGFAAAVLAAFALIAALALFWLSMKARSRALRVLGGCPTLRIQAQDLGGFAAALLVPAAVVTLAAAAYVGLARGWLYVGVFVKALAGVEVAVIAVSLLVALAMSASAWPSATMLATRQPAVKSLRAAAVAVQALTFLLLVGAAGPAWSAYRSSSATAVEMAQWKNLADQVAVQFGMSDDEMTSLEPLIGNLVKDGEAAGAIAFSYTFSDETWGGDLGDYSAVTFVNQRWLELMTTNAPPGALTPVPHERVGSMLSREFGETFSLLARSRRAGGQILSGFGYLRPADGFRMPVAQGGGGNLAFLDDVLVAVLPSLHQTFNDRNLTSMVSTRNILFTGVAATQALLERAGLSAEALSDRGIKGDLSVVYVAEEGILRAQFMAYVVWLMNLALAALVVAFTVAAAISALITALLHAKRDFPLRLSGRPWGRILQRRVAKELLAGAALVCLVALFQRPDAVGALLVAALFGMFAVPLSHLWAANWCFSGVSRRRI
ncbi:hypothetical protein GA0074695_0175 [Micromonospora viridifaciens]|uniref:Bacteriocin-associated integral membrane (Putative immunity) protein n=2 Tax=Micromonospora viridifaciens TaxID=1881 RepID=A0A1C4U5K6_MICVI|nr:hypothetical protein [Micromonospora viridifaciens]SCE66889.1 hypothetical protein GA0074695_0175 [Micromonospora viridifaciens]